MTDEIWKVIPGLGGFYEASDLGRIRVCDRTIVKPHSQTGKPTEYHYKGRVLKLSSDGKGYLCAHLGIDGKKIKLRVNRAVLMAFVGPAPKGMEACHNNGISNDNLLTNLRWDTHYGNNQDRLLHGTYTRGKDHPRVKISEADALEIRFGRISCRNAMQKMDISMSQFYRIKRGESWAHL